MQRGFERVEPVLPLKHVKQLRTEFVGLQQIRHRLRFCRQWRGADCQQLFKMCHRYTLQRSRRRSPYVDPDLSTIGNIPCLVAETGACAAIVSRGDVADAGASPAFFGECGRILIAVCPGPGRFAPLRIRSSTGGANKDKACPGIGAILL
jgi:hypothetical protein